MSTFKKVVICIAAWLDLWIFLSVLEIPDLPYTVKMLITSLLWVFVSLFAYMIIEDF